MALDFEFVGTKTQALSLDPEEFRGLPVPRITQEILKTLREISPGVSFFEDDAALAAQAISDAQA